MMGTGLPAYYGSIVITYGASFLVTALIGAAEIGDLPSFFPFGYACSPLGNSQHCRNRDVA